MRPSHRRNCLVVKPGKIVAMHFSWVGLVVEVYLAIVVARERGVEGIGALGGRERVRERNEGMERDERVKGNERERWWPPDTTPSTG